MRLVFVLFRYTEEMIKHPDNMDTMEKVARWLVSKYNGRQCLGTRLLLGEEKVTNNEGKEVSKFIQGEYIWITYSDLERLSRSFARGLQERGVKPRDKVTHFWCYYRRIRNGRLNKFVTRYFRCASSPTPGQNGLWLPGLVGGKSLAFGEDEFYPGVAAITDLVDLAT